MNRPATPATNFLLQTIQSCPDLKWATPDQQWQLASRAHHKFLAAGEHLFFKGDRGESLFLIIQGDLEIYAKGPPEDPELILARLFQQGDALGEWAATRQDQTRSASVRARGNSTLIEIPYTLIKEIGSFTDFLGHSAQRGRKLKSHDSLVSQSPLFNLMTQQGSTRLNYEEKILPAGALIFGQGDPSKEVFLILHGQVEIISEDRKIKSSLGEGQIFGELGVSNGVPRSTGARTQSTCHLLILQAEDFLTLARENQEFAQHLLTLRKIYRNRSDEVVLQFHYQVEGQPRFTSTIQLDSDRQLITDFNVHSDSVSIEVIPTLGDAMVFSYREEQRDIHYQLEMTMGVITAARLNGPHPEAGRIIEAIRHKTPVSVEQWRKFETTGLLFEQAAQSDTLCHCMQITRSEILGLVETSSCLQEQVMQETGAGTVCGGCRGEIAALCQSSDNVEMHLLEISEFQPGFFRARFTPKDQTPLSTFQPGQHVRIEVEIHGETIRRSYTLTSPANETRWREITFKNEPHGLFSRWLSSAKPGSETLLLSPPSGEFIADLNSTDPIIFLVAGIGVTPALNIVRSRIAFNKGPRIVVDHSMHSNRSGPCREELIQTAEEHPDVEYHIRETLAGKRLRRENLQHYSALYPTAKWMICGPEGFEQTMLEHLNDIGVSEESIRLELFHARNSTSLDSIPKDSIAWVSGWVTTILTALVLSMDLLPHDWKEWQQTSGGHWISGSALMAFLGWQWILPMQRMRRSIRNSSSSLKLHRRIGAFSPLLLLLHGSGFGAGILGLITLLFLTHTVIGIADRSRISGAIQKQRFLRLWLYPHIVISLLLTALGLLHVWLILGHGGPS
ncbi:hypothetical protein CBD41_09335 [bacterium TMED181]|nr:hypothetical protein [Planctomycetota bacterium]OUW42270.1 MAG: hypothetical protein CBD41_09335 [bacterium TMED181]